MNETPDSSDVTQAEQESDRPAAGASGSNCSTKTSPFGELPCKFGKYQIKRELGRGVMGIVYSAVDTKMGREVALKVPSELAQRDSEWIARFEGEARATLGIRHPNVCEVFDADEFDGISYLTMEYIVGQTLEESLKASGPLSSPKAAALCAKFARGLAEAHAKEIVHRDVKPGNIMIRALTNEPVLMDFGLAKKFDLSEGQANGRPTITGTPLYLAPERYFGIPATPVSELFSLGVILFELLTGKRPFDGKTTTAVIAQITLCRPVSPQSLNANVDPALAEICLRLLSKDPLERYGSAKEVADVLEKFQRDVADTNTLIVAVPSRSPSHSTKMLAGTIGLLLIVALSLSAFREPAISESVTPPGRVAGPSDQSPKELDSPKPEELKVLVSKTDITPKSLVPMVELHLQRANEKQVFHEVTNQQLPIKDGDKIHVHAELPTPGYLYLYWFDAEGRANRLWPDSNVAATLVEEVWSPEKAADVKKQLWHEVGGTSGLELILAIASQKPLEESQLVALEQRRVELGVLDRQNEFVRYNPQRGAAESERSAAIGQPAVPFTPIDENSWVLFVDRTAQQELVVFANDVAVDTRNNAEIRGTRGPIAVVKSPKEFEERDFLDVLRQFDGYFGVVFRHEN